MALPQNEFLKYRHQSGETKKIGNSKMMEVDHNFLGVDKGYMKISRLITTGNIFISRLLIAFLIAKLAIFSKKC
jgi:hypothetical protein